MPMAPGLARKQAERWLVGRHRSEFACLCTAHGRLEAIRRLVLVHQEEYERRVLTLRGRSETIVTASLARLLRVPPGPSLN